MDRDQDTPYITVKEGDWLKCVDARQSGGHLAVGEKYLVTGVHDVTNVYVASEAGEAVGQPHFWHVIRFEHTDAPRPAERGPENCRECQAKAVLSQAGLCAYCVRRLSAGPGR